MPKSGNGNDLLYFQGMKGFERQIDRLMELTHYQVLKPCSIFKGEVEQNQMNNCQQYFKGG